jgi:hypothetical protein
MSQRTSPAGWFERVRCRMTHFASHDPLPIRRCNTQTTSSSQEAACCYADSTSCPSSALPIIITRDLAHGGYRHSNVARAGFARLDGRKAHRGLTRNTQKAVLIEHRGFPCWVAFVQRCGSIESRNDRPYVQNCSLNARPSPRRAHALPEAPSSVTPAQRELVALMWEWQWQVGRAVLDAINANGGALSRPSSSGWTGTVGANVGAVTRLMPRAPRLVSAK